MVLDKKAQGLSLNVVVIIVILLVTLIVVIVLVSGRLGLFKKATDCPGTCVSVTEGDVLKRCPEGSIKHSLNPSCKINPADEEPTGICCVPVGG